MKKQILAGLFSLLLLSFLVPATCQAQRPTHTVNAKKFERLMQKENTVVLDVRMPAEFATGHLPGAINIDVKDSAFTQQTKQLDKDKKYLLYCRTGRRSQAALNLMLENGFIHLRHLKGGIETWKGPKEKL